jgi:hypothetical protein
MLSLGETNASDFRLEVRIRQHRWTGGVGLFVGCREEVVDGMRRLQFLRVMLESNDARNPEEAFRINRRLSTVMFRENGEQRLLNGASHMVIVPRPSKRDALLAIDVEDGRLVAIHWDDRVVFELEAAGLNPHLQKLADTDLRGSFGTFNLWSDCVYSEGRLLIAKPK